MLNTLRNHHSGNYLWLDSEKFVFFSGLYFHSCFLSMKTAKFTSLSLISSQIPNMYFEQFIGYLCLEKSHDFSQLNLNTVSLPDYRNKIASIISWVQTVLENISINIYPNYYTSIYCLCSPSFLSHPSLLCSRHEVWEAPASLQASLVGPHWYKSIDVILSPLWLNLVQIWQ